MIRESSRLLMVGLLAAAVIGVAIGTWLYALASR